MYQSREIHIGNLSLGGNHPVRVQSMCNTDTGDVVSSVTQCIRIIRSGASLVRLTVRNKREALNLRVIREELLRQGFLQPLIADVHFNPSLALVAATFVEKVRINPGNYGNSEIRPAFLKLIKTCKEHGTSLRIGVNHGSLPRRVLAACGNTAEGMVTAAMEYLEICAGENFRDVVVSLKSSNPAVMIGANRLLVRTLMENGMDPPVHLGVTEAAAGEDGRIRSAIGIGTLLCEGIGDTIRVSLTEAPEKEIPVGRKIIRAASAGRLSRHRNIPPSVQLRPDKPGGTSAKASQAPACTVLNIGPDQVPVVIASMDTAKGKYTHFSGEAQPDFLFARQAPTEAILPESARMILPRPLWGVHEPDTTGVFPLFRPDQYNNTRKSRHLNFLMIPLPAFSPEKMSGIIPDCRLVIVLDCDDSFSPCQYRVRYQKMLDTGFGQPVIIKRKVRTPDREEFMIRSSVDLGGLLIDRLCQGIWIENPHFEDPFSAALAFNILQFSGRRVFKTEYIACPSCGRTLFDIEKTLKGIRLATGHLKHLKIAVMGCIVNGPGEMADADYGYIGSGKGKITLFRGKEAVKRNIPEEHAVKELIDLIAADGKWSPLEEKIPDH